MGEKDWEKTLSCEIDLNREQINKIDKNVVKLDKNVEKLDKNIIAVNTHIKWLKTGQDRILAELSKHKNSPALLNVIFKYFKAESRK